MSYAIDPAGRHSLIPAKQYNCVKLSLMRAKQHACSRHSLARAKHCSCGGLTSLRSVGSHVVANVCEHKAPRGPILLRNIGPRGVSNGGSAPSLRSQAPSFTVVPPSLRSLSLPRLQSLRSFFSGRYAPSLAVAALPRYGHFVPSFAVTAFPR